MTIFSFLTGFIVQLEELDLNLICIFHSIKTNLCNTKWDTLTPKYLYVLYRYRLFGM